MVTDQKGIRPKVNGPNRNPTENRLSTRFRLFETSFHHLRKIGKQGKKELFPLKAYCCTNIKFCSLFFLQFNDAIFFSFMFYVLLIL